MFVRWIVYLLALFISCSLNAAEAESGTIKPDMTQLVLGKLIFEDPQLSSPRGQSCASCHQSEQAFADPGKAVSPGANPMLFGNRNAPSIAYVKFNPELFWNKEESLWMGGFFHDGRAKTLQEQAGGPFLNPLEMGNKTMAELVVKVKSAVYAPLFEQFYGHDIWSNVDNAFAAITAAIVVYEKGPEFASFDSKYDLYLQGKVHLSAQEKEGLALFEAEDKGNCAACHPSQVSTENPRPLFTDYSYDNLGQPANKTLNFYQQSALYNPDGDKYIDFGLANNPHIDNADEEKGKIKVPSLRNIAKTAPYFHNGGFTSLKEVVEFYNERDIDIKNSLANRRWANAEVNENINDEELGDLKLSVDEVDAIVAFMKTLTDGYQITKVAAEH